MTTPLIPFSNVSRPGLPARYIGRASASGYVTRDELTIEVSTAGITLTLFPIVKRITVKDKTGAANPNISITTTNGAQLEDPNSPGVLATTVTIQVPSQAVTWQSNGTSFSIVSPSATVSVGTKPGVVRVTSAGGGGAQASPYTTNPFEVVEVDESDGNQCTIRFEANPAKGASHTVTWWKWTAAAPPPVIDFNGKQGTPFSQDALTSGALVSTTAINIQGASQTWIYDGSEWVNGT